MIPAAMARPIQAADTAINGEKRMEIKISSKHMELTPSIEEYATKKMDKFHRFFDQILQSLPEM